MISTKIQNQSSVVTTDNNYPFVSAPYIKSTSESVACILLKQYNIQLAHKPARTLKHELCLLKDKRLTADAAGMFNPFMPTVAFNICCPRDRVSRHNGGKC